MHFLYKYYVMDVYSTFKYFFISEFVFKTISEKMTLL